MSANSRRTAWLAAVAALALGALAALPDPAQAQYFGRNKVQYETFDFRILRTPRFDIYYYPEEEAAARQAGRMSERWYARLSRVLDHEFEERQPVILYANHPEFQQTTTLGGEISEGTGGVTEAFKQRVIMPLAGSYEETDHVLGHELVHAFQYDLSGVGRAGGGLEEAARRFNVPGWFVEGMAEYLSVGPVDPHTAMWLRDAAVTGRLPTLEQLTYDGSYFPYRWGQAFWAYVGGRWGDAAIGQILKQVGQGVPYPDAFERILNADLETIVTDWQAAIRRTYLPLFTERVQARDVAQPLIVRRTEEEERGNGRARAGRINVGPALSPDGRRVAFLSELDFLDVELYVADAQTGEVQRRLVKGTAFDPHFGSLRYINSSGVWSPDGTRFAFSALRRAHDVLVVLDVNTARILREYEIPDVGEITNPTWSPDGRTVVVSGIARGIADLYAIDLETGESRQLSNDDHADMHPAFSPDGRTLAFTSDRGPEFSVENLTWGNYRLALYDMASGQVTVVPGLEQGKNINPQWTADGRGIFFISDRTGIPNVYRVDVGSGALTQVTHLFTGVSGFTDLSPAISTALRADKLVFTAYENNGYNIYSLTDGAQLAGTAPTPVQLAQNTAAPVPAVLPPSPRPQEPAYNRVLTALRDPDFGRPPSSALASWQVTPYRTRLSLDYLGQPTLGVAAATGPYARSGVYGGVGAIFSDVLGYHTVYGTVQAQGQIEEIGFSAVYLNRKNRWNWGVAAQRVPYLAGGRQQVQDQTDGTLRDQVLIFRYFDNSVYGIAQYPFSTQQRVEFAGGVRRIAQDVQIREYIYEPVIQGGQIVGYTGPVAYEESEEDLASYNLAEGSAALVYDNSVFSYTSPFAGQRYRFEAAPTLGDLNFTSLTADFRRYQFLRPLTLAARVMHFGRYGRDEAVPNPVFLGYPSIMRGYGYNSVTNACIDELEGGVINGGECSVYDDLFGSRMAVANLELRFPIFRQLIVGNSWGLPPVEGIAFLDAGTAWGELQERDGTTRTLSPTFRRGVASALDETGILASAGVGARVNLFGYIIVEAVYVNAFDRPTGWHWQFAFQPGF